MELAYVYYPFIGNIDNYEQRRCSWEKFVETFSVHKRVSDKMRAPGFGPYVLQATATPCRSHKDGLSRPVAHRCDECVKEMTMAVFDVDTGTQEDIEKCEAALEKANLSRLWYSSYSYAPGQERPSMRLVIPFSTPLDPKEWPSVRAALIYQYSIPCLVSACKGKSHFYFIPSCGSESAPISFHKTGFFLNHATLPKIQEQRHSSRHVSLDGWEPVPEPDPTAPVDLEPLRSVLVRRRNAMSRGKDNDRKYKSVLLTRLLAGEPLEDKGKRNDATTKVCGIMAYALSDKPVSWLMALLRPSLTRMQAAGSRITEKDAEGMLVRALRKKAEDEESTRQFMASLDNIGKGIQIKVPKVDQNGKVIK